MLDKNLIAQLKSYLALLEEPVVIVTDFSSREKEAQKVASFLNEVVTLSDKLSLETGNFSRQPAFGLKKPHDENPRLVFAGLPLGHEFASFVLALLQVSGRPPKISPDALTQIQSIAAPLNFETYVSLTCHNCPDVVQALNIMAVLNPNITSTMIEGGMNRPEVESKNVLAVPTVFLNGEEWANGRMSLEEILEKVLQAAGPSHVAPELLATTFDMLIVGGGPAASSAAIYGARKGLKVAMVMGRFGGQPLETLGIENIIGTPYIEGETLMANVEQHVAKYNVPLIKGHLAEKLTNQNNLKALTLDNGDVLKAKTVILATGAHWRAIGVPGEEEFKTKGVCYCPHCDGPLFTDKKVAVIGGGNSGIEAAIDLAGICQEVTVLEFLPELKADDVLQEKLATLSNVRVITNAATKAITGQQKVESIQYENRTTGEIQHLDVAGVFILIGLQPNTHWLQDTLDLNSRGEIVVDEHNTTSLSGVFAAGDCTTEPYKQIVIAMGSGATAALSAFDYLIRQK